MLSFQNCRNHSNRKLPTILLCLLVITVKTIGQTKTDNKNESEDSSISANSIPANERLKHQTLETELEIYPFNIVVPDDPVIKNEAMFDYHNLFKQEKFLGGIRFFADANTHWAKARDMKDLILYTELYYGFKNFQIGIETGSVTGQEYLSLGPQYTHYDSKSFKRVSLISRVLPDYVLGYEFTSQEINIFQKMTVSSTGMGRIVLPSNQMVIQASIWFSLHSISGIYVGLEYEYNNAKYFNNYRYETKNELFLGVKFELH